MSTYSKRKRDSAQSNGNYTRPSRNKGRSFSGGDRAFSRSSFRGQRRSPRRGNGNTGERIHESRFISKAIAGEDTAPINLLHAFEDFEIDSRIKRNVTKRGYVTPTPIQDQVIPHILQGRDIVGIADTGTGKTGAFLIPLLHKVMQNREERVLVLVPTRELAQQIEKEYRGFAAGLGLFSSCLVGGANISPQLRGLRQKPCMVIGTPGRVKDLIERKALDLQHFRTVVLDEADRMLDMGFVHEMRRILSLMPNTRQTLFFSATISSDIRKLVGEFLNDPIHISVKTSDTAKTVDQDVVRLGGRDKITVLQELLLQPDFGKVLVFGRTKRNVERLAKDLVRGGFKAASIHGNKTQNNRQRALDSFKKGQVQVLVATDVAARGIDVVEVTHVINYELPATYNDYIHRIGRTGRAGKRGKALTFVA